ncbi:MAG: hypothetical protein M3N41_07560 [Acidobacteriota bacterium]|nr:hypothetical protein [Acidobacteriota bacterium]
MTKLRLLVVCCLALPFRGFAQTMDSAALRAKYGEPLARETFQVRPNIEAVVTYGPGRQVCRIELPPWRNAVSAQQVDEVVAELVPQRARGKEIRRMVARAGRISMASVEYENVNIAEPQDNGRRTCVTITFNHPGCR